MLTQGNIKLGPLIWGWSIPVLETCPGASEICELLCYAKKGRFRMRNVKESHKKNLVMAKSKEFAPWIIGQIRDSCVQVCRIDVAGDFFSKTYIKRWLQVVRSCRRTKFFAYTRSYVEAGLLDLLVELGREPNMRMYFSWDRSMPFPPRRKGILSCYLSENDKDLPNRKTDLVFRNESKSVMKRDPSGNMVCPYENGATSTNCSKCKICWDEDTHDRTCRKRRAPGGSAKAKPVGGDQPRAQRPRGTRKGIRAGVGHS